MFSELEKNFRQQITLSDDELQRVMRHFVPKKLRRKQFLLEAGDVCTRMAFVSKGALFSYATTDKGSINVVQFAFESWWMADLYSFFTQEPSKLAIEALEDSELLLLKSDRLEPLMAEVPAVESYLRILYQNAYVALQRRMEETLGLTAEQRYKRFMQRHGHFLLRVPQHLIASYLGVTPETLSRIRKQAL
ncbi:Crp/Fnr family transcriptional regulator [Parapedobacter sp.]